MLDVNPHHAELGRGDSQNIIDARWIDLSTGLFTDITGLSERQPKEELGVWSCKDFYRYHVQDVYPLQGSEFESVNASVPHNAS